MNAKQQDENLDGQIGGFSRKPGILNDNEVLMEEDIKYEMFRKVRLKLGKTTEEFHKIFELYHNLRNV